eukprot:2292078-Pyramimonas_sp.AAC.1
MAHSTSKTVQSAPQRLETGSANKERPQVLAISERLALARCFHNAYKGFQGHGWASGPLLSGVQAPRRPCMRHLGAGRPRAGLGTAWRLLRDGLGVVWGWPGAGLWMFQGWSRDGLETA